MSEKRGPSGPSGPSANTPYGPSAPPASYQQMVAQGAPPSYAESLSHPVVAGHPGVHPQFSPYITPVAAASAVQLQNYKDQFLAQSGQWYLADPMLYQSEDEQQPDYPCTCQECRQLYLMLAANQQAQKLAMSQQAQQQQAVLFMQQQQAMYMQQLQGYYPAQAAVQAASPFQPGQNVLVMQNGYDGGARFDGVAQPSIPPPPPGVAPNAAQLAAASGAQVAATQKKSSFLSGVSGGGYTFF